MSDPITIFREAAAAVEAEDWQAAAALCDPATLSLFKRELLARLEIQHQPWTAERLRKYQPDMPLEVAEFQAANLTKITDPQRILADEVPGIASVDELRELSPLEVFAAWLDGQSHSRQVERAARDSKLPPEVLEHAMQQPLKTTYHVLGVAEDGERLAHVVFRREHQSAESDITDDEPLQTPGLPAVSEDELAAIKDQQKSHVDFATLRRQPDGTWRMLAGSAFLGRQNPVIAFGYDED